MWYETLQEAMDSEKAAYIEAHTYSEGTDQAGEFFGSAPRQFNLAVGRDGDQELFKVEFMEESDSYIDATTWASSDQATKIFIECDADKIDLSLFDEDWITEL